MSWRRGQAYGQDLRDRVLAAPGWLLREVAERFGVSTSCVLRARRSRLGQARPGAQMPPCPAAPGHAERSAAGPGGIGTRADAGATVPVGQG